MLATLVALVVVVGCGDSAERDASPPPAGGSNRPPERQPAGGLTQAERTERLAIKNARTECQVFGAKEIAKSYGGNVSDLASLAHAYATDVYQPDLQIQTEAACLEGLLK
jgi:hypothetical protein